MLMSTPGEIKTGDIKRGGFMNNLVNMAADAVLDIYVTGYFGCEYKSLVSIGEDGVKIERDQLKDFLILTNLEPAAQKYFDEATVTTIAGWKKSNVGFTEEKKVDQFGLLFSPDGVILACQSNMNNANEVKAFSDFGAALTAQDDTGFKLEVLISSRFLPPPEILRAVDRLCLRRVRVLLS